MKEMLLEKLHVGNDVYELIRKSWLLYKIRKNLKASLGPRPIIIDSGTGYDEAVNRFAREFPGADITISGEFSDGKMVLRIIDDSLPEAEDREGNAVFYEDPASPLSDEDQELLHAVHKMILAEDEFFLPVIRKMIATYQNMKANETNQSSVPTAKGKSIAGLNDRSHGMVRRKQ